MWCLPVPPKSSEELTFTQDLVECEGHVLCEFSQLQVHRKYGKELMEGLAWGCAKSSRYDFDSFVLYYLELFD